MPLSRDAKFRRNDDTLFQRVDAREAMMMSIDAGYFYRFNASAARVWELLQSTMTIAELSARLCREFRVDVQTCEADLSDLIEGLCREGMIRELPTG